MIPIQPRVVRGGFLGFNSDQLTLAPGQNSNNNRRYKNIKHINVKSNTPNGTPRKGLAVLDLNSYNNNNNNNNNINNNVNSPRMPVKRSMAVKPSMDFQTPPRPITTHRRDSALKSSPRLVRVRSPFDENSNNENGSSDEEEVFFGTVSINEQTKANKLKKSRRRTMIQSTKTKKSRGTGRTANTSQQLSPQQNQTPKLARRAEYAALVIQSFYRMHRCRSRFVQCREAVVKIQSTFRGYVARKTLSQETIAALIIQRWWRNNQQQQQQQQQHHQQQQQFQEQVSSPRSPAELQPQSFFNDEDTLSGITMNALTQQPQELSEQNKKTEPPSQPTLTVPLTGFEAKMERLRQLREKRKQLEMKLQGKVNDGSTSSSSSSTEPFLMRSTLLGRRPTPRGPLLGKQQQPHHQQLSSSSDGFNFNRIARWHGANANNLKCGAHSEKSLEQERDRVTRLNTARNSSSAIPTKFRNHISTFVEVQFEEDEDGDVKWDEDRALTISWNDSDISDEPQIPTYNQSSLKSILKDSTAANRENKASADFKAQRLLMSSTTHSTAL